MSGTLNDPIAQLLSAFGIAPAALNNTGTISGLGGVPLANMTNALGGPAPAAPVIPAATALPAASPIVADPITTGAVAPLDVAAPTSPIEAALPSSQSTPTGGGDGDIHSVISGLLQGFGMPANAPAAATGSPIAQAISGIGHGGGGLGGGLK